MYHRTKSLLKLKNIHYVDDESLGGMVKLLGDELISDVYKYETLKESQIASYDYNNQDLKCKQYLRQLNYVRQVIGENRLLDLTILPNTDITIFESKYPLYPILNTNRFGTRGDSFIDVFEKCLPTEQTNYFCFRNSLVEELGLIEFSVANFGTLLIDVFQQSEKIEVPVIRDSIISDLGIEAARADELLTQFLRINLIINFSLLVVKTKPLI